MGFVLATVEGRAALRSDTGFHDLERLGDRTLGPDPLAALGDVGRLAGIASGLGDRDPDWPLDVSLGPPVPRPPKILGVGLNYPQHAAEARVEVPIPTEPLIFVKLSTAITGPTGEIELRSDRCDYEGELVVVMGRGGRDIPAATAWDHIAGLTVGQDVSDRGMQLASDPISLSFPKSFDTFAPIGPVVVSPDLVDRDDLELTTEVNGEVRQADRTSRMAFDVPTLVGWTSRVCTLEPGDLIFTGTPAGVGSSSGRFLADGDVVRTSITGIGTMDNVCRRAH